MKPRQITFFGNVGTQNLGNPLESLRPRFGFRAA